MSCVVRVLVSIVSLHATLLSYDFYLSILGVIPASESFSTGAGGCPRGRPAIGGFHLQNKNHKLSSIHSDWPTVGVHLFRSKLQVRLNSIPVLSNETIELITLTEYSIDVVSLKPNEPFKGALIRVELSDPKNESKSNTRYGRILRSDFAATETFELFSVTNSSIKAEVCELPAKGITHFDDSEKITFSGVLVFNFPGIVMIDITVVDVNDADQSMYFYDSFSLQVQAAKESTKSEATLSKIPLPLRELYSNLGDNNGVVFTDTPVAAPTSKNETNLISNNSKYSDPTTTVLPIATQSPSQRGKCSICGKTIGSKQDNDNLDEYQLILGNPNHTVRHVIEGITTNITTCGELEQAVKTHHLDPIQCQAARLSFFVGNCKCVVPIIPPGLGFEMESGKSIVPTIHPTENVVGVPSGVGKWVSTLSDGPSSVPSQEPLSLPSDIPSFVQRYDYPFQNTVNEDSSVSPSDAPSFQYDNYLAYSNNPSVHHSNLPSTSSENLFDSSGSAPPTHQPNVETTNKHGLVPTGSDQQKPDNTTCFICGYPTMVVTNPDSTLFVFGTVHKCRDIEQAGLMGYISRTDCPYYTISALINEAGDSPCGCSPQTKTIEQHKRVVGKKSISWSEFFFDILPQLRTKERPNTRVPTSYSTVTSPTMTRVVDSPTIIERPSTESSQSTRHSCSTCGAENHEVKNRDTIILIGGIEHTCGYIYDAGKYGFIDMEWCADITFLVQSNCHCIPSTNGSTITQGPPSHGSPNENRTTPNIRNPLLTPSTPIQSRDVCNTCGTSTRTVSDRDRRVIIGGVIHKCGDVYDAGRFGNIDKDSCTSYTVAIQKRCDCIDMILSPHSVVTTFEPTVTPLPTVTVSPTYDYICDTCGNASFEVKDRWRTVQVLGVTHSCGDVYSAGLNGHIPPERCSAFVNAVQSTCHCVAKVEISTTKSTNRRSHDAPVPSPIYIKGETYIPTVTLLPTQTSVPTFTEVCYTCGDESLEVQENLQTVEVFGVLHNCVDVYKAGLNGYISPKLCDQFTLAVQNRCHCVRRTGTKKSTPRYIPTSSPVIVVDETFMPTITALPTKSAIPTFTILCYTCGDEHQEVTSALQSVQVFGIVHTCGEVYKAGLKGYISPELCEPFSKAVQENCDCNFKKSPAPAPEATTTTTLSQPVQLPVSSIDGDTFVPTVTAVPTRSQTPTFSTKCYTCGDASQEVNQPFRTVNILGMVHICGEVFNAGLKGNIPPDMCDVYTKAIQNTCDCSSSKLVSSSPITTSRRQFFDTTPKPSYIQTYAPSRSEIPTSTPVPTHSTKCYTCGSPMHMVHDPMRAIVVVGRMVHLCGEIYEAGIKGFIAPDLCEVFTTAVLQSCDCRAH